MNHKINVEIGGYKTTINTSVVDVNTPLLLGMDYLKKWGVVIDTGKDELYIRKSKESFVYNSSSQVPIKTRRIMCKQAIRLGHTVEKCVMNESHLRTHI